MDTQASQGANPPAGNKNFWAQMEDFFDTYLHKKAPFHLPPKAKEVLVKVGPWITLILMILAIPVILAILGLGTFVAVVYGGYRLGPGIMLQGIISIISLVLEGLALPGLFARTLKGWHLVYYAALVSAVGQLLGGQIIGMIIGLVISLYILFEIKEYYK